MRNTELLSQIRKLQGISQQDIAQKIGVRRATVAQYEAGIPSIGAPKIELLCDVLSVDKEFLDGKASYPFRSGSFIKFYVRGLSYRLHPLIWLDLLLRYTKGVKVLLLRKGKKNDVVAACARDNRGSIFLISIEVPLTWMEAFDYRKHSAERAGTSMVTKNLFDLILGEYSDDILSGLRPRKFFPYLENWSREKIEKTLDKAFADILSEEESGLIELIRKKEMPLSHLEDLSKKDKDIEDILNRAIAAILSDAEKKLIELIRRKEIPIEPLFTMNFQAMPPATDEKELLPDFTGQLVDPEQFQTRYDLFIRRERVNMFGEDIYLEKIPVGTILKDALKYLKFGEDDKFKAAVIESITAFYHARILRDFSEDNYKKDLQRAFDNFRISPSDEQAHDKDRPPEEKS